MADSDWGGEVAWRPSAEQVAQSNLHAFMRQHGFADYPSLLAKSTGDIAWFWNTVLQDLDIRFYTPYSEIVDLAGGYYWPRWCVGGVMNIVHNCLDKYIGTPTADRPALKWEGEEGATRTLTYGELSREVNRMANGLRALGLKKGDAIGLYMPMTPEIVIALLAIVRIGGTILPLFSGYGPGAAAVRLNDAGAKALFTADGAQRRGQVVAMKPIADQALAESPTVEHVIVMRRAGNEIAMKSGRDHWWDEVIANQGDQAEPEHMSAEDLVMLIYTSGTTGKPKGAVHTHCGFPIKAAQDMYHGLDVKPADTLFWMTDMGWMMGPWEVFGTLLLGATMFLYDGAPDYPGPDRIWAMIERHGVSILGLSPTFVRAIMKHGDAPVKQHRLDTLRAFGSTGEPWNPTPWLWLFNTVGGGKLPIINYSGGTEISGGILMGNMLTPQKPGSFAGPVLGMDADVLDDAGQPVRGRVGELVIKKPWIGMTRGFWHDPERYLQTYWSRWPNVWVHGDWAVVDTDGLWYIQGRSDDVIKVAGKRLGPAEVESALVKHPAVQEAAAIGVPDEVKGEAVVCFVILKPNNEPSDELKAALRARVADELGKPLAPHEIVFVHDLPKTRNAKIMRRVVRAVYLGKDPGDVSSLENPGAVEEIRGKVNR
ncbi:MAG: AMP-binding protein [Anaerolineae bacterium]